MPSLQDAAGLGFRNGLFQFPADGDGLGGFPHRRLGVNFMCLSKAYPGVIKKKFSMKLPCLFQLPIHFKDKALNGGVHSHGVVGPVESPQGKIPGGSHHHHQTDQQADPKAEFKGDGPVIPPTRWGSCAAHVLFLFFR